MFHALTDCEKATATAENLESISSRMYKILNDKLVLPFCQEIETSLRLQTHSHLQMTTVTPFQQPIFEDFILHSVHPVKFIDEYISVRSKFKHSCFLQNALCFFCSR